VPLELEVPDVPELPTILDIPMAARASACVADCINVSITCDTVKFGINYNYGLK
jgi:hypothetical protein